MRRSDDTERPPSRSARKREAHGIEEVARALVDLPEPALERLPAGEEIRRELGLARATRGHGSRDRQIRHLAAVLRRREEETAVLRKFIAGEDETHYREQAAFHRIEKLRERLCDPERFAEALTEAAAAWPGLDTAVVGRLSRACHSSSDRRPYRELFRLLRRAAEGSHETP